MYTVGRRCYDYVLHTITVVVPVPVRLHQVVLLEVGLQDCVFHRRENEPNVFSICEHKKKQHKFNILYYNTRFDIRVLRNIVSNDFDAPVILI